MQPFPMGPLSLVTFLAPMFSFSNQERPRKKVSKKVLCATHSFPTDLPLHSRRGLPSSRKPASSSYRSGHIQPQANHSGSALLPPLGGVVGGVSAVTAAAISSPTLQGRGSQGLGLEAISEPEPGPESWLTRGQEEAQSKTDQRQVHIQAAGLSSEGAQLAHPGLAVTQQNSLFHSEPGAGARDAAGT